MSNKTNVFFVRNDAFEHDNGDAFARCCYLQWNLKSQSLISTIRSAQMTEYQYENYAKILIALNIRSSKAFLHSAENKVNEFPNLLRKQVKKLHNSCSIRTTSDILMNAFKLEVSRLITVVHKMLKSSSQSSVNVMFSKRLSEASSKYFINTPVQTKPCMELYPSISKEEDQLEAAIALLDFHKKVCMEAKLRALHPNIPYMSL